MQNTLRLHSSWTFHGKVPPEKPSQSVEKASEYCLLVCNMIAPESGAQLYEGLTFQRGDGALFGSRSADDGQQKCQDHGAQDTYPQYLRNQVSNSRTNKASRTVRKVHPLASGKQENMRNCMVLEPYQKRSYTLIVRASIWERMTIFLSLPIDHIFTRRGLW